ncbi:hypothetical protein C1646_769422 [Rhizophagus diaphanus]|nr:hypothetical protein C1646_769422 [Rhizophagus diaphanus] [Rhizophagus sp. MUCL 43196]
MNSLLICKKIIVENIWQADLKPNARDVPYFPIIIADIYNSGTYKQIYHRGVICVLLLKNDRNNHLTKTAVDIKEGGSFIFIPKAFANKKCTINPDNKDLIDPDTDLPFEKYLQGVLDAYFAYKDGYTQNLKQIFRAEKLKLYLKCVNFNGILISASICPHIFSKIEGRGML